MSDEEAPEFDVVAATRAEHLSGFRERQPGVWAMASLAYLANRQMALSAATSAQLTAGATDTHRLMMWYTLLEYQVDAFFLIAARRLGAGVSVLRLASELARDIARIGTDNERLAIWLQRQSSKQARRRYRAEFLFDDRDPSESYVHKLYDLASTFGVHGHTLDSSQSVPIEYSSDGSVVVLAVPDTAVYRTLAIWLAAAFPLNVVCAKTFACLQADGDRAESYQLCEGARRVFDDAFKGYRASLKEMRVDVDLDVH